jgi:2-keto-4-pentenoate hydratase/2-oxohepta-3-ene-1,7-dioic acid hydratase in catechol pathway
MKFLTYRYDDKEQIGVLNLEETAVIPLSVCQIPHLSMNAFLENVTEEMLSKIEEERKHPSQEIFLERITKCPPIPSPKQDVICLGINYMAHAVESARYKEEAFGGERPYAVYFSKRVNRAVADGEEIDGHFDIVDSLDYEVELAVVIGKDAKNVSKEEAFDYVFGYTILNDISARNLQTAHKQWYFGKSLDGFTPMGPWIVTKDEFQNPPALGIRSYVNGELRQNSTTDLLIFDIAHVISELSQGMTLQAGTIIAMGTPAGVGMGFVPPNFLKKGDTIRCEIEGIGSLVNIVK